MEAVEAAAVAEEERELGRVVALVRAQTSYRLAERRGPLRLPAQVPSPLIFRILAVGKRPDLPLLSSRP